MGTRIFLLYLKTNISQVSVSVIKWVSISVNINFKIYQELVFAYEQSWHLPANWESL